MSKQLLLSMGTAAVLTLSATAGGVETGQTAPSCALTPVGSTQPIDMHQFQGKLLYVDFWASWCPPCARSFPFMNELDRDLREKGLVVLGINVDEKAQDATAFLAKHPASFALAADSTGQCPQQFGVQAMPSSYLVDANGTVRHVHLGFRAGEAQNLRAVIEKLLSETAAIQQSDASDTTQ